MLEYHTLDSSGKPNMSILRIKPNDHRRIENDNIEPTKEITQKLVKLKDEIFFKYQLGFYCHFGKKSHDGDYEKEDHHNRLEMKPLETLRSRFINE